MRKIAAMSPRRRIGLVLMQSGLLLGVLGAALFGAAGTFSWPQAWRLLAAALPGYAGYRRQVRARWIPGVC